LFSAQAGFTEVNLRKYLLLRFEEVTHRRIINGSLTESLDEATTNGLIAKANDNTAVVNDLEIFSPSRRRLRVDLENQTFRDLEEEE